jgi:plastocyanin
MAMATEETTTRDAESWARHSGPLSVGDTPEGALNLNVEGRELAGPMQGFGKLWQKTYRVALPGVDATPQEVIAAWKANYGEFWPEGNNFYAPLAGIQPGEVGLINADMPGGMKLSTGVMVLYADDVSFTYMTPLGHPFAGWITFSADDVDGTTHAQVEVLMRATDPASEVGLALGGHRTEDRMWAQTLANLASFFGLEDPRVDTSVVCVDRRRQWRRAGNLRHDAALHTAAHLLAAPVRAIGMSWRGLLLVAVATNVVAQAMFMLIVGIVIVPAVVLATVQVLGLAVMSRFERTGAGVVAVGGAAQLAAYLSFAVPSLGMPQSPLDFVDAVLGFLTAATMVVGGIALLRRRTGSPRRLALAGAVVIGIAGVVATIGGLTASSDALDVGDVEVAAVGYLWVPTELTAASDGTLHVDNRDLSHHVFAIPELDLEVTLPGSTARDLPLDGAAPGTYAYVCTIPGHEAMTGTIEITE